MNLRWVFLLLAGPVAALDRARGRPSPSAAVEAAQKQLQAAGEKDEAAHDKAGCFCQRNLAEKQQTVEDMQQQLTGLSHDIDEQTAKIAQLDVEVKLHQEELETSSHSLSTAEALRQSDQQKFTDDEQTHVQSIDSLQSALSALKDHHSTDISLTAIQKMGSMLAGHEQPAFVQLQRHLRSANSPAVVSGVIKQMLTGFTGNLQKMRDDETEAKNRHEGLVSAKGSEIRSQKKGLMEKSQRLAKTKVALSFKSQIKPRSEKVLEENMQLLGTLKQICQHSDDSFQARRDSLQAETTALAEAQTEIAGSQLLSVAITTRGDGAEMLCSTAPELREEDWREQATAACKQARNGKAQAAAEAVESLETDIREAQNEAARKQDDCTQEIRESQVEGSVAKSEENAESNFVDSTQKDAEEQIQAFTSQSDSAVKAKADYQEVATASKEAFQALRTATARGSEMLNDAASRGAGKAAAMQIAQAIKQSEKLMAAVNEYSTANDEEASKLASLLDGVQMAAGKALIPLRLMRADSEESSITIKEEAESRSHERKPQCDAVKLMAEVARFKGYRAKLGKAAEGLAWETLR